MIAFRVDGDPQPQGSKKHVGGGQMVESAKGLKLWRRKVTAAAQAVMVGEHWLDGPLLLTVIFHVKRPKYHYRTGRYAGLLKDSAPVLCVQTPDTDKLVRAIGDSLTGVVYRDDSQVAAIAALKVYSERPGAVIVITPIEGESC